MERNINGANVVQIDPNSTWGLNIVSTIYTQEVGKINNSLAKLASTKAQDTRLAAECAFAVAGNVMLQKSLESATELAGGASGVMAGSEASSVESEVSPEISSLDKQSKDITEKLKTAQPAEKDALLNERDQLRAKKDRLGNKVQNAHTKSQMKMNTYSALAKGAGAIFDGMAQSAQNIGNANKSIFEAQQHQDDQAIQATAGTLQGFISADYNEGLKTVSNIHLVG